ncbi:MAG TPA: YbhB/YbcL family Raf kinase inhibitor-like protein [Rhodocyclaceae bacterium]|jgi:hypothetical protein
MLTLPQSLRPAIAAVFLGISLQSLAADFRLTSPDIDPAQPLPQAQVANSFGCDGGNRSPALVWQNPPVGTKSFAVTVYDPDAPTGSGWWHWLVFDIPASAQGLPAAIGNTPQLADGSRQGRNDGGSHDFGGACPPPGDKPHRYIFTVHALKTEKLEVPTEASPALIGYMIGANRIGKAGFTVRYGR